MAIIVTNISLPSTISLPTLSTTSSESTSHLVNSNRGPPQTICQAAVSQGARFKANRPVTSQAAVQLLDILDKFTEELQCEESVVETRTPQGLMKCYQAEVYFTSEIEDKNKEEFVEVITLSHTRGSALLVNIAGVNCNALMETVLQEAV